MISRCNSSVALFALLSFLVFFHVILVLIVFACFDFSSLHHSKWVRSIFILLCQAYFVSFRFYRSSISFVMFHPVTVTVCFSVIYLVSHIYPSPSTLTLHHDCLNFSVTQQTATTQFKLLNTIPLSFILSSSRTQFRHTSNIFLSILILLSGDIQSNFGPISPHSCLSMCTLNTRSLTSPLPYTFSCQYSDWQFADEGGVVLEKKSLKSSFVLLNSLLQIHQS